jgi:hypothetical protein
VGSRQSLSCQRHALRCYNSRGWPRLVASNRRHDDCLMRCRWLIRSIEGKKRRILLAYDYRRKSISSRKQLLPQPPSCLPKEAIILSDSAISLLLSRYVHPNTSGI